MRRELSSTCPETDDQAVTAAANTIAPLSFRKLATRKVVVGTAAFAALAAAAGLGAAAPAMTAAADSGSAATHQATAADAGSAPLNLQDLMDRTLTTGLGSAQIGGAWSTYGATFSVTGGEAHLANVAPGVMARATLEGVQVRDESLSTTFSLPAIPTTGTSSHFGLLLRRQTNGDTLFARVKVAPGGAASVSLKLQAGSTSIDIGPTVALASPLVAGRSYVLDAVTTGGSSATVKARAYAAGTATPDWQTSGTVALAGAMTVKGSSGVYVYAASNAGPFSVDVDAITGQDLSAPATSSPSSSPTSSSPSSSPTSSSPSSSPTSSSPSSSPTSSSPSSSSAPTPGSGGTGTVDPEGGIGFASNDPSTDPTTPVSTPPTSTPPTSTPPTTGTTPPPPPPTGKPGPDNTGVRPGVQLQDFTPAGGKYTAQPGDVLENLDIHGMVIVNVANVVIRNCIIRGATVVGYSSPRPMVWALGATNLQIIDSELAPSISSVNNQAGIMGKSFSLTRVDIHGSVDGIEAFGGDITITASWIHDTAWFPNSTYQNGGPTHNDGIQVLGGSNITVTGSTFENFTGSALQITPQQQWGPIANMTWTGNWIDGGACSMNISAGVWGTLAPITLTANRFGNHQTIVGCAIIANQTKTPLTVSGNVWDANNLPVVISRGA